MNKKQIDMIFKVLLDTNDDENPFKYTIARVNKCGRYNLRGAEKEDIEAYSMLLIAEYLNTVSIDYWNDLTDEQKEKDIIVYCNIKFDKMSRTEGINNNIICMYNKDIKKYEYRNMNNFNIDDLELSADNNNESQSTLTQYIFDNYINNSYLTKYQLKYIDTVVNNYIDTSGNVRDIKTNEILYTKQASYKHKKCIEKRLIPLIDNDPNIHLNNNDRWVLK